MTVNGLDSSKGYYLINPPDTETERYVPKFFKRSNQAVFEISGESEFTRVAAEQLVKTGSIVVEDDPMESAKAKFQKIDGTQVNFGTQIDDAEYSMYLVESDGTETKLYFEFNSTTKTYVYKGTSGGSGLTANLKSQEIDSKKGQFVVDEIGYGIYFVQEVVAPLGYQLDSTKHYFRVSSSTIDETGQLRFGKAEDNSSDGDDSGDGTTGDTSTNTMDILSLNDSEILSTIELNKTEEVNPDKYLGYATYKLFRLNVGKDLEEAKEAANNSRGNTNSDAFKNYWTLHKKVETDISGQATMRGIPFGTYLLYEDQPPTGYKWNNDSAQWETWTEKEPTHIKNNQIIILSPETLEANSTKRTNEDGTEEVIYHTFYALHRDERKDGEARLLKKNSDGNGMLDGNFTLCKVNLTTAEKYAAIANQFGKTLEEVAGLSETERNELWNKTVISVSDVDIALHFDTTAGKPKNKAGTDDELVDTIVAQNLMTNKDGLLGATDTISGLDWGVYYFYEVKAPAGYQRDTTPQVFKVDASNVGSKIEVNMSDEKTYGKIWLYKQAKKANDDNSHNKLFGAKFSLYTKSNEQVYAVPRLALNGLKNSADGVTDGQKEFLVKKITVDEKNKITFQLEEGYNITVQYEESKDGNITVVTPDSAFIAMYVEGDTYSPVLNDTRLTYYIVTKDKSKVFDNDMKKYRNITATELTCLSDTYITADTGGQFCVRGLDWGSYYFREIVPPEGYGLADDVIFTVNAYNCDNQFLACEDPEASAAIIVDKEIPDADYFKAYGEPTFMFKVYGLTEASAQDSVDYTKNNKNYKKNGSEYTLAIHLTEPNTKGTAMINVPVGQYLIEELPISRYVCCGLELVEGSEDETIKVKSAGMDTPTSTLIASDTSKYDINNGSEAKPWTAFCDLSGGDSEFGEVVTFHIKYTNEIQQYDNFSYVSFADNQIPGQEYITAFKPLYTPLITVNNGADDYIYSIDLAKALTEGDFEAVLSYNTEKIEKLTDLTHIQFSNANKAPIKKVEFDGTTLKVTVSNPVSLAGQAISIDVGYCEDDDFTAYNESNTNMVKGTLTLTFSEVKADVRKRVILKNDVTNKTYFPYADPEKQTKDVTSVALIYTQDAENTDNITKYMENPDYTDTLDGKRPNRILILRLVFAQ